MDEISVIDISHIKATDKIHFAMTQFIFYISAVGRNKLEFKNTLSPDSLINHVHNLCIFSFHLNMTSEINRLELYSERLD